VAKLHDRYDDDNDDDDDDDDDDDEMNTNTNEELKSDRDSIRSYC
jgi:hypothetical protein